MTVTAWIVALSEKLGVLLSSNEPFVMASGGVMVQMMPGANEHIITMIEDTIAHVPHVTSLITDGATPADLLREALGVIEFEIMDEKDISFKCSCSFEKAEAMIASLGRTEVEAMIVEDKGAGITCGFCNETYRISEEELEKIAASL